MFSLRALAFVLLISYGAAQVNYCRCVPYYLCDRDDKTVITDGKQLIDERFGGSNCTADQCNCKIKNDVCCYLNPNETTTTTENIISPDATSYVNTYSTPTLKLINQCGYSNPDGVGYKVRDSAEDVAFGEFSWMVLILVNNINRCGGTLIHPSVVLTAAHCVTKNQNYVVRAGEWDVSNTREILAHQERQVTSKKIHVDYRPGVYYNDIALLFLNSAFNLEQHIGIACLPPKNAVVNSDDCIATGWGKNKVEGTALYAAILKKVNLPIVDRSSCQTRLKNTTSLGQNFVLHKSFICAGGIENQDTCVGDGGGPLLCPLKDEARYQQIGITSWGLDCNKKDLPGVYSSVAFFRDWIDKQLKEKNYDTNIYQY